MKRILFYYPSNKRSIQIETTLIELKKMGYEMILLTTCEAGDLHQQLKENNIPFFTNKIDSKNSFTYYYQQITFLIKFCKSQNINIVFSNLQHTNFIAVIAQFFMSAKVISFRHHFKFNKGNFGIPLKVNKNEVFFDKIINRLAKKIIVPSKGVYNGILENETIGTNKMEVIPYLYDFSQYGKPNLENVEQIKEKYPAHLRLIMVARVIPFKRHILIFPIIKKLIDKGLDIKMMILDEGVEKEKLQQYIDVHQLNNHIFLLGFKRDFLDYMKASDLIIHPSLTEASNNVIKEIGLMEKAVAVCRGVGDFDEYIEEGRNGYFMDIAHPEKDAEKVIEHIYSHKELIPTLGQQLKRDILSKFGNNSDTLKKYQSLIESI